MKRIELTRGMFAVVDDRDFNGRSIHLGYFNSTGAASAAYAAANRKHFGEFGGGI